MLVRGSVSAYAVAATDKLTDAAASLWGSVVACSTDPAELSQGETVGVHGGERAEAAGSHSVPPPPPRCAAVTVVDSSSASEGEGEGGRGSESGEGEGEGEGGGEGEGAGEGEGEGAGESGTREGGGGVWKGAGESGTREGEGDARGPSPTLHATGTTVAEYARRSALVVVTMSDERIHGEACYEAVSHGGDIVLPPSLRHYDDPADPSLWREMFKEVSVLMSPRLHQVGGVRG